MKIAVVSFIISILVVSSVSALSYTGGYGGQNARLQRAEDPYSRMQYFGTNYSRPLANYGSKGPQTSAINAGARSAYSSVFTLNSNGFTLGGRNPSRISNVDPNVRGYAQMDVAVPLLPAENIMFMYADESVLPQGTARIVSEGNAYGSGLGATTPRTKVYVDLKNLPPLAPSEIYEAWLVDSKTEYALSVGLMHVGLPLTAQLHFEFFRSVVGFDGVMVTKEKFPDSDPSPGQIMLQGQIGPMRTFVDKSGIDVSQRVK